MSATTNPLPTPNDANAWDEPDVQDDLSRVLRYVARNAQAKTRARLANSLETRTFLELGVAILRTDLLENSGSDLDVGERTKMFESVSRNRLIELAAQSDIGVKRMLLGETQFRNRWIRKEFYVEDLIAYVFRLEPQERHIQEIANAANSLMESVSLGELIRLQAAFEVDSTLGDTLSSLQCIIEAALPNHPRVQEFVRAQVEHLLPRWASIYERIAAAYGLDLAPGITFGDIAMLFSSALDGIMFRARIEGAEPKLSNGHGALTGIISAMVPSLFLNCPQNLDECHPLGTA
jgi:hypothetical protein